MSNNQPMSPSPPNATDAAVPPRFARALAFAAILVAGLCGGLIGHAVTDIQVSDDSALPVVGAILGAVLAAVGVAVVAVLALRAMTEWRTIDERRARDDRPIDRG